MGDYGGTHTTHNSNQQQNKISRVGGGPQADNTPQQFFNNRIGNQLIGTNQSGGSGIKSGGPTNTTNATFIV